MAHTKHNFPMKPSIHGTNSFRFEEQLLQQWDGDYPPQDKVVAVTTELFDKLC